MIKFDKICFPTLEEGEFDSPLGNAYLKWIIVFALFIPLPYKTNKNVHQVCPQALQRCLVRQVV